MSSTRTSILLLGATGYIGGSVLYRLLKHPKAGTHDITALVRSPEKAKKLETFGVKTVVGSLDDYALIEDLASKAQVVFNTADSDNIEAIRAILRAANKRHTTTGELPVVIHTSGTAEIADNALGNFASDVIYDDTNIKEVESIPDAAFHRNVSLELIAADKAGYVRTYIVLPSTIYGRAKNPFVDAGIQNPQSVQIPLLIKAALGRKQAGVVGKGVAIWPEVSNDDISDLYIALYDAILSNPDKVGHGGEGYYYGENGEHTWYSISLAIGEALVSLGISKSPEPTTFTDEDLIKFYGSLMFGNFNGTNARCRANRARSIGWKPKHTTQDLLASIKPEVEAILKQ